MVLGGRAGRGTEGPARAAYAAKEEVSGYARAERVVIGRGADLAKRGALQPGERMLQWPSKLPDFQAEWKLNSGFLRQEMRKGLSIRDASPGDTGGIFLNAERSLLTDRGWSFEASTNLWSPPGQ